jgi:DNA-directed RNA polymerase subunit H
MADSEVEHLLDKLRYNEVIQLAKDEKLEVKGNKNKLVSAILEHVDEERIRAFFKSARGIKVDISEHEFVPRHEVMKKEDVADLLKNHHCKISDLPKIFDTDPISLKIGAKAGDIVRIKRKSPTAGQANYYRLVVKSI